MNFAVIVSLVVLVTVNVTMGLPQQYLTGHVDYARTNIGYPGYQPIYPAYPTYPVYPVGGSRVAVGGIGVRQTPYGKTVVAGGLIKAGNRPYYPY